MIFELQRIHKVIIITLYLHRTLKFSIVYVIAQWPQ